MFKAFYLLIFCFWSFSLKAQSGTESSQGNLWQAENWLISCEECPLKRGAYVSIHLPGQDSAEIGRVVWHGSDFRHDQFSIQMRSTGKIYHIDGSGYLLTPHIKKDRHPPAQVRVLRLALAPELADSFTYTLVCCGRRGFPGHAFIRLDKQNGSKRILESRAQGLFPKKLLYGYWSMLKWVPGFIRDESKTRVDVQYGFEITASEYAQVMTAVDHWNQDGRFHLFSHDCVTFTRYICNQFGASLELPNRKWLTIIPYQYIKKLRRLNLYLETKG
ncbi:MAG: hypothetical protein KGS48_07220 [Bacteroidetes bacterium]|nr:hypothetical protein [Bacteroidota bacterium]